MTPERLIKLCVLAGCGLGGLGGLAFLTVRHPERASEALILALLTLVATPLGFGLVGISPGVSTQQPSGSVSSGSSSPGSSSPSAPSGAGEP
ncbi:hypothetical protein GCM10009779_71780 [Polymorphospora rubra]